jgi:hypothetical protein
MQAKASELCSSQIVAGPFTFHEIEDKPGVYRLSRKSNSSAVVVAMKDGRFLHVKDDKVNDFLKIRVPECCTFWATACEVPDEIN